MFDSQGNILQTFNITSQTIEFNTTDQTNPAVEVFSNDSFIVAWQGIVNTNYEIWAMIF